MVVEVGSGLVPCGTDLGRVWPTHESTSGIHYAQPTCSANPRPLPNLNRSPETWVHMGRTVGVAGFDLVTIVLYLVFLDKAVPFIWHKKKKLETRRGDADEESTNTDPLV